MGGQKHRENKNDGMWATNQAMRTASRRTEDTTDSPAESPEGTSPVDTLILAQ